MCSDFLNKLSRNQPEIGGIGVYFSTVSFFQSTLFSMLCTSLVISS